MNKNAKFCFSFRGLFLRLKKKFAHKMQWISKKPFANDYDNDDGAMAGWIAIFTWPAFIFFSLIHISFTSFFTSFNDDDDHHHRGLGRCSLRRRHTCTNHQEIFAWVVLSTFFFHSWRYFLFLFFLYFYGMKKLKRKKRKESRKILPNDQRNQSNFY